MTIFWKNDILQNTNNDLSASFDHQIETFGVDTAQLKEPITHKSFCAGIKDWEDEAIHNDCCVT